MDIINKADNVIGFFNKLYYSNEEEIAAKSKQLNPGDSISSAEIKISNNTVILTEGDYSALITTKPNTNITGLGEVTFKSTRGEPQSTSGELTLDSRIEGARFEGTINILNNATTIFQNCVFTFTVNVQPGSNAHFIGCLFQDNGFVLNAGTAYIIGCSRKSPIAHVGITATYGETT